MPGGEKPRKSGFAHRKYEITCEAAHAYLKAMLYGGYSERAQHQDSAEPDSAGCLFGPCLGDLRQENFLYSEHVPKP